MADFNISNQYGQVFLQGETVDNHGPIIGSEGFSTRVDTLVSRLDELLAGGAVREDAVLPVRSALLEAVAVREPERRVAALGRARELAAAVVGLAGLAEAIDRILPLIPGS